MTSSFRVFIRRYAPASVLKVTGEDAFAFLQGQFTQELRGCLKGLEVAYGLWLNQKGRVQADSFVLRMPDGAWWVISVSCPAATIRERLESYVVADDVAIEDVTGAWSGMAVVGQEAGIAVKKAWGALPDEGAFSTAAGGVIFRGRRDAGETWEWLYPRETTAPADALLAAGAKEMARDEVEYRRIQAGLPAVPVDVGPEDLPNEAGLERVAISYTKGCYLGQEVMARLASMGQVRRKLMRVSGGGAMPASLPAPLFAGQKKAGELRSVTPTETGFVGLAMISLLTLGGTQALSLAPDLPAEVFIRREPS